TVHPAQPRIVDRIGPPLEGNVGGTARELRVWPQQHLLMVFNFACGAAFGDCTSETVTPTVRFYDLTGQNAAHPKLISTYRPSPPPPPPPPLHPPPGDVLRHRPAPPPPGALVHAHVRERQPPARRPHPHRHRHQPGPPVRLR